MSKSLSDRKIRLPVQYVGGNWELLTGGMLPVHPKSVGELLVDRHSIADPVFLENMDRKCHHKVLDEGTKLLVRMADRSWKDVPAEIKGVCKHVAHFRPFLGEALDPRTSGHCIFVEVSLGGPDRAQKELFESNSGGLWLLTQGPTPIGLASSQIVLPKVFGREPVASLNHAYTALSEVPRVGESRTPETSTNRFIMRKKTESGSRWRRCEAEQWTRPMPKSLRDCGLVSWHACPQAGKAVESDQSRPRAVFEQKMKVQS